MKATIKKILRKLRKRCLGPLIERIERQENRLMGLIDANYRLRDMLTRNQNKPTHVVFVCHEPGLWNMFESVYKALDNNSGFRTSVVALPHQHGTLAEGLYEDKGVFEFLKERGVNVIQGYNKDTDTWLHPAWLNADYLFFQTPYQRFPELWSIERVSVFSRICYIPYGTVLENDVIGETSHPESFFRHTDLFFMEAPMTRKIFIEKFHNKNWCDHKRVILSGHPKYDRMSEIDKLQGKVWKRGLKNDFKKILWSTRWRTSEGTCHFFDYKDYFFEFCKKHPDIDFVFRPHPLLFQNFLNTGEMSLDEKTRFIDDYDNSPNMNIDMNKDYADTFLTSNMLITDISSFMIEYLVTGKPIIYTHRVNSFNEFGQKLSEGCYWVRNSSELNETISMLLSGEDPLQKKRKELMKELIFIPEGGAGEFIKKCLQDNKNHYLSSKRYFDNIFEETELLSSYDDHYVEFSEPQDDNTFSLDEIN